MPPPGIFRPSFGTVVARTCSKFHVRQGVKVTIFHPIKYWSCTIAAQQREEARYTLLVFWNFTLRGLKQKVHISQQKKWHFNFSLILIGLPVGKEVVFLLLVFEKSDVRFSKTYLPTLSGYVLFCLRYLPTPKSDILYGRSLRPYFVRKSNPNDKSWKIGKYWIKGAFI